MTRKIRRIIRSAALALFLFILLRLFGVFKPQQPHQAYPGIPSISPFPMFQNTEDFSTAAEKTQEIHIVAAVCGNRTTQALVMMKSALIMCSNFIRFTLFVDSQSSGILNQTIRLWPGNILKRMSFDLRPFSYPDDDGAEIWKKLFRPCSSARLFFPSWLKEVDSILYMDVDAVFLSSPLHIWKHLTKMNHVQMVALAPEKQSYVTGWYPQLARHPYYGKFGMNAGVMLMNLTKMRQFGWEKHIVRVYERYKTKIEYGDQDIINVFFHFHPEKLYVYACNYNYISHQCAEMSLCKEAEQQGIHILHGNADAFVSDRLPALKAIYTSIQQHSFGDSLQMLFANMKNNLMKTPTSNSSCFQVMSTLPMLLMDT
ncbi:glucoside xylosyltransferase 2-like [Daphnia carinata]|uniref:glucoside xylosyltransferase 2-like n=1 Tax=Daphnia carinata TaxID=120202 RepID=UPI00257D9FFB|nr:glucoside xylosyltransferase 2-like [Daphnia carinata]